MRIQIGKISYAPSKVSPIANPETGVLKQEEKPVIIEVQDLSLPSTVDFPDGGLDAWSVVAGAWLVSFCTFGYINAFGVYQDYYQTHQLSAYTPSDISWIGSLQLAFILWGGLITGRLFDKGYIRWIIFSGSVLAVFSLMMTSLASTYYQIVLAQGVGLGLGFGFLYTPAISCIAHWFRKRRALANGVLASGSSLGGIIFPIMLNKLANNPNVGFAWAVRATGFVELVFLVVANMLLKTRLPKRDKGKAVDFAVFKDITFSTYTLGAFFVVLGIYVPFFYLQAYAITIGVQENIAFYSLSIVNAASLFGRLIPNYVADYVGPLNVLITACVVTSILIFVFLALHNAASVIVYAIFFGFFSGPYFSLMPACTAAFAPDMSQIGISNGMVFFVSGFAALFGTPIAGAVIARQGIATFWGAATFAGVGCFVGVFLLFISRVMHARKTGTWRV